jgi:hypothetical protein
VAARAPSSQQPATRSSLAEFCKGTGLAPNPAPPA